MRLKLLCAALATFILSAPANATTLWEIQIEVFATGSEVTYGTNPVTVTEPFEGYFTFMRNLYPFTGTVNINSGFDSPIVDPLGLGIRYQMTGQLSFIGGQFIGTNFVYSSQTCRLGGPGCVDYSLRADTFGANFVRFTGEGPGPVPEPSTWAMMLMGFAAIGFSVRRRPRAATTAKIA